jgi:WD40 repeat protein
LIAGDDPVARIWDPRTGRLFVSLEGETSGLRTADLSGDGTRALTVHEDGTAVIWDASTGERLQVIPSTAHVSYGDLSEDGTLVALSEETGTIGVWDAETGVELTSFIGHSGNVGATFNADATKVLTWGDDGTSRIFSCELCQPLPQLLGLADARVTRELTPEERERYGV